YDAPVQFPQFARQLQAAGATAVVVPPLHLTQGYLFTASGTRRPLSESPNSVEMEESSAILSLLKNRQ
ncbi:MAG TPA: hypothetical protein VFS12_02005, partial [Terriglobia bacterium]|nr:hypothetical protein [Terriglobia bacterium]